MNARVKAARVVIAYKRRLIRKLKRRSPQARIKAKQYYRKRKAILRLQRRRYTKRNKLFLKSRKVFKRSKPHWLVKHKHKTPKPKYKKPRKPTVKKFHSPKRHPVYKAKRQHTPKMVKHTIPRKKHGSENSSVLEQGVIHRFRSSLH